MQKKCKKEKKINMQKIQKIQKSKNGKFRNNVLAFVYPYTPMHKFSACL